MEERVTKFTPLNIHPKMSKYPLSNSNQAEHVPYYPPGINGYGSHRSNFVANLKRTSTCMFLSCTVLRRLSGLPTYMPQTLPTNAVESVVSAVKRIPFWMNELGSHRSSHVANMKRTSNCLFYSNTVIRRLYGLPRYMSQTLPGRWCLFRVAIVKRTSPVLPA